MVSGYYTYNEDYGNVKQGLKRKVKHIFRLLICAEALYFVTTVISLIIRGKLQSIRVILNINSILSAFLINKPMFNGTLWFLYALLFAYIILYLVNNYNAYKMAYSSILVLLLGHIIVRTILKKSGVEWYDATYFRNALVYGFPMLMLGNLIRKYQVKCCKVSTKVCAVGVVGGTVITFLEYFLSREVLDFYIGTLIVAYCLFIFALNNRSNSVIPMIERIGCKLSLGIYVSHMLCIGICSGVIGYLGIENNIIIQWTKPILSLVLAIVLISIYVSLKNKIYSYNKLKISSRAV